jgi:hypothetical protein
MIFQSTTKHEAYDVKKPNKMAVYQGMTMIKLMFLILSSNAFESGIDLLTN